MAREARNDKISRLTDDILWHILSYLPTVVVARTSVLSTRWRQLWTSVTSIDMADNHGGQQQHRLLVNVKTVLRFNNMYYLRQVRLKCLHGIDKKTTSELIQSIVTTRIVEHLDLCFRFLDSPSLVQLPPTLFTCNKLVDLKLSHGLFNLDLSPVHLPCIKILRIFTVLLVNDDTMSNLLKGCPVLEKLTIYCYCSNLVKTVFIRSSSLKRLTLSLRRHDKMVGLSLGIAIDAVNLEHLDILCYPHLTEPSDIRSVSVSLVQVKLQICCFRTILTDPDGCGDIVLEFLRSVSNVKCMDLSCSTLQCLARAKADELPMFHNLSRLKFMVCTSGWHLLPCFLECSPNLSTIVLEFLPVQRNKHELNTQQYPEGGRWMLCLKQIIFEKFSGCENEMEMVRYFLKKALNLKKMNIFFHVSPYISLFDKLLLDKDVMINKVSMFPRSSSACRISAG